MDQSTDGTSSIITTAFLLLFDITNQSDDNLQEKIVKTIAVVPNVCGILIQNVCHSGKLCIAYFFPLLPKPNV